MRLMDKEAARFERELAKTAKRPRSVTPEVLEIHHGGGHSDADSDALQASDMAIAWSHVDVHHGLATLCDLAVRSAGTSIVDNADL